MIDAGKIKNLREKTGISMMDCKKALENSEGDEVKAIDWLRKQGIKTAEKKSGRGTKAGLIEAYVHGQGQIGVLVEMRSETDFVAKNPAFSEIAHNIAMQIAAANPTAIKPEDVPPGTIEKEKEIYREQAIKTGKPENIVEGIVQGKLNKFYEEKCLLNQPFIKDPNIKIADYLNQAIQKFGENIEISRFARFEI